MNAPRVDLIPQLGLYFSGLVDGEGCFSVEAAKCAFILKLRDDDLALLEWLRASFGGIGTIHIEAGNTTGGRNRKPQARWAVTRKRELVWLTELFERYPLRSKKGRDFEIWRDAVVDWYTGAPRFEYHRQRMRAVRAYPELTDLEVAS